MGHRGESTVLGVLLWAHWDLLCDLVEVPCFSESASLYHEGIALGPVWLRTVLGRWGERGHPGQGNTDRDHLGKQVSASVPSTAKGKSLTD